MNRKPESPSTRTANRRSQCAAGAMALLVPMLLLAGCKGVPTQEEKEARRDVGAVTESYRPRGEKPTLPALTTNSSLGDFLAFAMLNSPSVEAAYYDWTASVEGITPARSLPDPKLTFQAYIQDSLTSLMPGFSQDFPGPGKLKAAAGVAAAGSRGKYFVFESAVLQTAFDVKRGFYNLHFLDERIRINRRTLEVLAGLEQIARAQNEVGKVTLQDVLRAQIEQDRLATETATLEDSRRPLMAQFKGTLGLTRGQPDPALPARFETTPLDLDGDALLDAAFARNAALKAMEADVRTAEASIVAAGKSKVPDFSVGLQAEVYSPPFYWPQAGMSLPVWRDKIAAQIAAAQAGKHSAEARLTSGQIALAVDLAVKTYDYREATRNLALLQTRLIPKAEQSLEIARSSYLSGRTDFFNVMDAQRTLLGFQLAEVEARTRREIILADLSLTVAGIPPTGAPVLPDAARNSLSSPTH